MNRRKRRKFRLVGFLLCLLVVLMILVIRIRLYPLIEDMAKTRVSNQASNIINDAIDEQIKSGSIHYEDMIVLEKDAGGNITALRTDMSVINRLKAEILDLINDQILDLSVSQIGVPIGNLLLPEFFSGRGFYLPVRILSISSSGATFENRFSQAGINQTLHQIVMNVEVSVMVLTPAGSETVPCSSQVVIAETVIVGTVPNSYVSVGTSVNDGPDN